MDTPFYPPATAYEAPRLLPYALTLAGCSVAELMANPAAWKVVVKHMPSIAFITKIPATKKLLDNMTVIDFSVFGGPIDAEAVAAINAELAHIPGSGALR